MSSGCSPYVAIDSITQNDSARLGSEIFDQHAVRDLATAALAKAGGASAAAQPSVTRAAADGWVTSFVTVQGDAAYVTYEVRLGAGAGPIVGAVDPPRLIDPEGGAIARAQRTARDAVRVHCGDSYEPVVLPGSALGKEGWLVYLLAGTDQPVARVIEGHRLIRVSADGRRVIEEVRLSRRCNIEAPIEPRSDDLPGMAEAFRTLGDEPNEADYFTAMRYRTTFILLFPGARSVEIHGALLARGHPPARPI